jgi:putative glutamine amidotransferase
VKPKIGVTTSRRGGWFMWECNRLAVTRAGGRAVRLHAGGLLPLDELSGLVVGGGDDITATIYGGTVDPAIRLDAERDRLELDLIEQASRRGWPVLGICRGAQMINVFSGGSLHTDIYAIYKEAPRLRTVLPRKLVHIEPDSRLSSILDCTDCSVNALHHQSVDRLGRGLRIVAKDEFGIVQGIESIGEPLLLGVQWHPEFLIFDSGQQRLFRTLVDAARRAAPATVDASRDEIEAGAR